jgi:peptide/nickel transport system permease protein
VLEGGGALLLWGGLLAVVLGRFSRVSAAFTGGLDERVALGTLAFGLLGLYFWSFTNFREAVGNGERVGRGRANWEAPKGSGSRVWRRFRRNRMALVALGILCALYLVLLLTPFLAPFGPEFREAYRPGGDMSSILAPPSLTHIMGTDQYSQDVFSRILYGSRISLTIGLAAVGVSVILGGLVGAVSGFRGGWTDRVLMRLVDMILAFPRLVLLIAIVALFPTTVFLVVLALAFTQWPFTARLVRGEILTLKEREYAEAARALGFSGGRILFRHLLPNAAGPLIVMAALGVGNAIILEAGLSFLGLGVQAAVPSWGSMVSQGRDFLTDAWWVATFPGLAIVLAVLSFNLVGDGLRDALDPRQEGGHST